MKIKLPFRSKGVVHYEDYLPGIVRDFNPPSSWNFLRTQILFKKEFTYSSINAQLIDLHLQGYLNIRKDEGKIIFSKTEKSLDSLHPEVKLLCDILFKNTEKLSKNESLLDLKNLISSKAMRFELCRVGYCTLDSLIKEGYINSTKDILKKTILIPLIPLFIGFCFIYFSSDIIFIINTIIVTIIVSSFVFLFFYDENLNTDMGFEMIKKVQGLHKYIKVAEEDRIAFHNNPKENIENIHQLLPYTILFNMRNKWERYMPLASRDMYYTSRIQSLTDIQKLHFIHGFKKNN